MRYLFAVMMASICCGSAFAENLALGKTVTVSSEPEGRPWFSKAGINDGSPFSTWGACDNFQPNPDYSPWAIIDLAQEYSIDKIRINRGEEVGAFTTIAVSTDNDQWIQVYSAAATPGPADLITFDPVNARYVKFMFLNPNLTVQINEIEIFPSMQDGFPFPMVHMNSLAFQKPATASTSQTWGGGTWESNPAHAVDGYHYTFWMSDNNWTGRDQWLMVDLEAQALISGSFIVWDQRQAKKYDIQVSDDAQNWTTVLTADQPHMAYLHEHAWTITHEISPPVAGRYVRLFCYEGYNRLEPETMTDVWLLEFTVQGEWVGSQASYPGINAAGIAGSAAFSAFQSAAGTIAFNYNVDRNENTAIRIFDSRGRMVATVVDAIRAPGSYRNEWNTAKDCRNAAGVYQAVLFRGNTAVASRNVMLK